MLMLWALSLKRNALRKDLARAVAWWGSFLDLLSAVLPGRPSSLPPEGGPGAPPRRMPRGSTDARLDLDDLLRDDDAKAT